MNVELEAVDEKSRDTYKVRTNTESLGSGLIQYLMRMS